MRLLRMAGELLGAQPNILIEAEINELLRDRSLFIEPHPIRIAECSVDVRLDNLFGVFISTGDAALDPAVENDAIRFEHIPFFSKPYYIQPGTFLLAQTLEYVALPRTLVASLDGRSALGRRGLVIHATAGWIDPGFEGHITLELANLGLMPVALYPGMRVGRLVFHRVKETGGYDGPFNNQYQIKAPAPDEDCRQLKAYAQKMKTEFAEKYAKGLR
jgi:dCTP deaminase